MINKTKNNLLFILITFISLYILGCAANRTGTITISSPRIWQDHAVVATAGEQYQMLNSVGEDINKNLLKNFQGKRARRYYDVRGLRGAFQMQYPYGTALNGTSTAESESSTGTSGLMDLPDMPNYSDIDKYLPEEKQSKGILITDFKDIFGSEINEDPIDLLQRVDDFNQVLSGMKLMHLRDTLSMEKGWSVYLLGFDISLLPGDKTQEGHGARVEFTINNNSDDVRIYSIWPQRYADRFQEGTSSREDFRLALKGAAKSSEWAAQMAMDMAQRYEDDLAHIQRYPLISGFINNNNGTQSFGWEFNPRIRTVTEDRVWPLTNKPMIKYWLEPGVRQCYALLAVNDDRIEANNRLLEFSKNNLEKIAFGGTVKLMTFKDLIEDYQKIINNVASTNSSKMVASTETTDVKTEGDFHIVEDVEIKAINLGDERRIAEKHLDKLIAYADSGLGSEGDKDRWNNFKESLRRWQNKHKELVDLINEESGNTLRKIVDNDLKRLASGKNITIDGEEISIDNIKDKYDATIQDLEAEKKEVPQSLKNYFDGKKFPKPTITRVDSEDLKKWELTEDLLDLHYCVLGLFGHKGKEFVNRKKEKKEKELELTVKRAWFDRKSGHIVKLEKNIFDCNTDSEKLDPATDKIQLTVATLPDKLDRTLIRINAVLPNEGIADGKHQTTVSIRGENFSNDAKVYIGGMEVPTSDVTVLGRDFIAAKFPAVDKDILNGETKKEFDVKVATGGDFLVAEGAFTYIASSTTTKKEEPFAITKINPKSASRGKFIEIEANNAVMDKVKNVKFGTLEADMKNNKHLSQDKKTLAVQVPYKDKDIPQPGEEVYITLEFDPEDAITDNNKYTYKERFTYSDKKEGDKQDADKPK